MINAFILDLNLLSEHNLSVEEFITLCKVNDRNLNYHIELKQDVLNSLETKLFIKQIIEENEKIILVREKGKILIDLLSIEGVDSFKNKKIIKRSSRAVNNEIEDFVETYRNLWKGLKPGAAGSSKTCTEKLQRWMFENPTYDKKDILSAAKRYINSLDNYKYLQSADYFVFKKDGKEESSRLSTFIDDVDAMEDGWTSNLQ